VLYIEGISEFLEEYKDIEQIIISEEAFKIYQDFIEELAYKNKDIIFSVVYKNKHDEKINIIDSDNIFFYEKEEFIKLNKTLNIKRNEKEEFFMDTSIALENENSLTNYDINLQEEQTKFLETSLGKVINSAIDIGLKAALPDLIEDEVIEVKDAILENGFKEGLNTIITSSLNLGKSAIGIFTGNFENVSQIQSAVKNGGLIDSVSSALDSAIKFAKNKGLINQTTATLIKQGKNTILKSVTSKIENELTDQVEAAEKLESYCNKWKENYENQNFSGMESNYKNIEKYLSKITPFENTITQARTIENLHSLIKNNGNKFELTENEKILAEKLAI
jgi:hypothetical protein